MLIANATQRFRETLREVAGTPPSSADRLRLYAWSVGAVGAVPIGLALVEAFSGRLPSAWVVPVFLAIFSAFFVVRLPSFNATISISETFVFAAVVLFGPAAGVLTVVVDGVMIGSRAKRQSWHQLAFNLAAPALSVWLAAHLLYATSGMAPVYGRSLELWALSPHLLLFALTYSVLNTGLTVTAVTLDSRLSVREFLTSNHRHLFLDLFTSVFLLFVVVGNAQQLTVSALVIIVMVLVLAYYSSRSAMQAAEASQRHLSDLNEQYHSMVDTLALAISARGQVSTAQIHRVQDGVVTLGRHLGVTDERDLKALEAAALLHELGTISVPEHILSKPGSLTAQEREQLQKHAEVGADIIGKARFPYPVEPIVRHHQEHWDGTGYPAGLRGEAIPLGCRVLAVVQGFDALRSKRAYRRALTEREAMEIIESRAGTLYDPTVVEAFVAIRPRLTLGDPVTTEPAATVPATAPVTRLEDSAEVPSWVSALAPDALAVLYRHDGTRSVLLPAVVTRGRLGLVSDLEIPLGERLSGWVGAHRETVTNGDPRLDFEDGETELAGLRSCLSVPIVRDDEMHGVLSLYADASDAFSAEQVRLAERMAPTLVECFSGPETGPQALEWALAGEPGFDCDDVLLPRGVAG